MTIHKAKDKILAKCCESSGSSPSSIQLSKILNIPHYLITASLLELNEEEKLQLIEIATSGMQGERAFVVQLITGKGRYFNDKKSHQKEAFWKSVKHFVNNYWAVLIALSGIAGTIYQTYKSEKQKSLLQSTQDSLRLTRDSLNKTANLVITKNKVDSLNK